MQAKHYKIVLLSTADGFNLCTKKEQEKKSVIVFLYCDNRKKASKIADKIAEALSFSTTIGNIEYVVKSVKRYIKKAAI
ncbi:MAG: hypothetical protein Q7K11_00400 [Candidatus Berkelbacteria bacterium]|nr:hypothetical protein [Candidatus Berkelbacteria bacterium]